MTTTDDHPTTLDPEPASEPAIDPAIFDPDPRPTSPDSRSWWWWPLVAGGAVLLLVGAAVGRATAPSDSGGDGGGDDRAGDGGALAAGVVVDPGPLLGEIGGSTRYEGEDDVEHYRYAWPGQELTAPDPVSGDAVAWQWELCDVPPSADADATETGAGTGTGTGTGTETGAPATPTDADPAPLECAPADDATDATWASPPTNRTRLVRVVVTVDLGNDVLVDVVSTPVAAVGWPGTVTPGDPPPGATPPTPPTST